MQSFYRSGQHDLCNVCSPLFEGLPRFAPIPGKIESDGYVIGEVVDDGLRFMDGRKGDAIRRAQVLWLWATLSASGQPTARLAMKPRPCLLHSER